MIRTLIITPAVIAAASFFGAFYALHNFKADHSFIVIQSKDSQYLAQEYMKREATMELARREKAGHGK